MAQEDGQTEEAQRTRNWSFVPGLSIKGTYSDNIELSPDGEEDSDFATEVNPAFSANLEGRRVTANVNYQMQNLLYADNSNFNKTYHQYDARAKTELWREHFFVDGVSTLTQRIVDSGGKIFFSNVNPTSNRTDQLTASISPYLREEIGSFSEAILRYEFGIVDFEDDKVRGRASDSMLNGVSLIVNSLPEDKLLSWSLDVRNQYIDFDNRDFADLRFSRGSLELDYRITRTISLIGVGGYEDNQLGSSWTSNDPNGAIWEAGARLQPTPRTLLEGRYGDRFFGDTYNIQFTHRTRRLTVGVRYIKDIGGLTDYLLRDVSLIESPYRTPLANLSTTSEAYVRKRLTGLMTFTTSKSEYRLSFFNEDRDFKDDDDAFSRGSERRTAIDASWRWRFLPRTAFTIGVRPGQIKPRDSDDDRDYIRITGLLERRIGPYTIGSIGFAHTKLNSDDRLVEYDENAITLSLTRTFE